MTSIENPDRQLSFLQQCLSSNKRPLGLFIGAGCPKSIIPDTEEDRPLIPDIAGMSAIVRDKLSRDEEFASLLSTVEEHFRNDGRDVGNVEEMLTHIRALRVVAGKAEVRGLSSEHLDKLDNAICDLIYEVVDKQLPNLTTAYHSLASWTDAVRREYPVEIFTTNYDLLMEQAFEDLRVPYFDGFAGVRRPFFDLRAMENDALPSRWARLWKLHGSINWYQAKTGAGVFRGTAKEEGGAKRVIHPSHLKYQESRRMPYLAMFDRLRAFLKQATASLVLCGYSFHDQHINEVVVQGLESTQTAVSFALLFGKIEGYQEAVSLARGRPNLNLLASDGAVISGKDIKWLERETEGLPAKTEAWLRWIAVGGERDDKRRADLTIGDFSAFGAFLKELAGTVHQEQQRAADAR